MSRYTVKFQETLTYEGAFTTAFPLDLTSNPRQTLLSSEWFTPFRQQNPNWYNDPSMRASGCQLLSIAELPAAAVAPPDETTALQRLFLILTAGGLENDNANMQHICRGELARIWKCAIGEIEQRIDPALREQRNRDVQIDDEQHSCIKIGRDGTITAPDADDQYGIVCRDDNAYIVKVLYPGQDGYADWNQMFPTRLQYRPTQ